MKIQVLANTDLVAQVAAGLIAKNAREAVDARGRFIFGVSGGRTPWMTLSMLATADLPWPNIEIVQVDERIAPAGSSERNIVPLRKSLENAPLRPEQIHAMPVDELDLARAAGGYGRLLQSIAGTPPVLDLSLLGLGDDGHTASLVPNDQVLGVNDSDVALSKAYRGRRRMTLTYPMLNRSRHILWIVTGREKTEVLARLCRGDASIPAGGIRSDRAELLADAAAAGIED